MGTLKHILVTGASGYLGRNLVKFLSTEGYKITLLARSTSNLAYLDLLDGQVELYQGDELNIDSILKNTKVDVIIHTAASYGRKGEALNEVLEANLMMPIKLLDAAINNGVKYFINTDTALPKDLNDYSRSKKHFLDWLKSRSNEINIANLQLEYFFGPNDDSTKFITYVINEMSSDKTSIDFTEASQIRDFIYIDDVIHAYNVVIESLVDLDRYTHIEIGLGKAQKLRDIIITIKGALGNNNINLNFGALPMRQNEIMESVADNSFLKNLGWTPKYTFEEGLKKTIENG